jgi:hypothetical protein
MTQMTLREWWRAWPWDVRLGYAAVLGFSLWAALSVAAGPNLLAMLSVCLVVPLMGVVVLVVGASFVIGPRRWARVVPLALASGCVAGVVAFPGATVDLHLIGRIYLAGGPGAVNDWGQQLIREQREKNERLIVEYDRLPTGIRQQLSGFILVDETLRIELGGGFYHYGVVVYPTGARPAGEWWQRALGWPHEVVVYHDED